MAEQAPTTADLGRGSDSMTINEDVTATFLIGTESGCHLRIDPAHHPGVAGRHCEVYYDHRTYVLFNRSEDGTWINDAPVQSSSVLHPGDRIRLGVGGPVIKFLGQPPRS